ARPLAVLPTYLYASPRYLDRSGEPVEPADLEHHECLGILKTGTWTLHDGTHTIKVSISGRFTLNSVAMIRRLGALDMGIIMMLEEIVTDDLASGRLRRVLPQWHGTPVSVYAVTETRLLPAKTQRFIEFLKERLPQGLTRY
ncbi:MAG: substrate binding domain-containing protein, partial [Nitrosospira sp.]|nr:substrate binding domain-containing protein [Nitrosospira sp.]